MGVKCSCPSVCNDIVTPHHLLLFKVVAFCLEISALSGCYAVSCLALCLRDTLSLGDTLCLRDTRSEVSSFPSFLCKTYKRRESANEGQTRPCTRHSFNAKRDALQQSQRKSLKSIHVQSTKKTGLHDFLVQYQRRVCHKERQ